VTTAHPAILGGPPAFPDGLPFVRPPAPPLERVVARLAPSYERGVLTNGPLVREFEQQAAEWLGVPHAVAVSNCTAGLMLACQALRPAGPVVLPSFTFSASAHALAWNGLDVRFAECDPASFQLDLTDAAARLDGAGGLLATHIFGAPAPAGQAEALALGAGIPLIFDAAHAFGARLAGRPVGGFGDAEIFSLSPTKVVVAGEGGVVATRHDDLARHVRLGRDYGNPGDYNTEFAGLNARMSELHAAIALESLDALGAHLDQREAIANRYRDGLGHIAGVDPQAVPTADRSTWKDFTVRVDAERAGIERDLLVQGLRAEGVDTRCYFFPPVHQHDAYRRQRVDLPVTDRTAASVISLPIWRDLPLSSVDAVVDLIGGLTGRGDEVRAVSSASTG